MRLTDLYGDLFESITDYDISSKIVDGLPPGFAHSMPATHSMPGMDQYYEFYRFVIALAGHPDDKSPLGSIVRDNPVAVAYTKQEHDMIHKVAKRMGIKPKEMAYKGSTELPDTFTVSPVMKFHMSESQQRKLKTLLALSEAMINASN
jgi:hypothetical protein